MAGCLGHDSAVLRSPARAPQRPCRPGVAAGGHGEVGDAEFRARETPTAAPGP